MKPVIIRTYSAGVHFGYLVSREGKEVTLSKARRIWRWYGANTINEIATTGLNSNMSRVSTPVEEIVLTEAIEVVTCTETAVASIEAAKWAA